MGLWLLSAALLGIFFYRLADGATSIWLMMLFPVPVGARTGMYEIRIRMG